MVGHIDAAARGAPAARDAFAIADGRITGHGKCSESIHAAAWCIRGVFRGGFAVADGGAAAHIENGIIIPHTHATAAVRCTTDDAAAGHDKFARNIHTAAVDRRAADNIATLHGQFAAGLDIDSAAIVCVVDISAATELDRISCAAGDDAAGDGFGSVLVQHPKAVGVWFKVVRHGRAAVGDGQVAAAFHRDPAIAAGRVGQVQHMAVQVESDRFFFINDDRPVNGNIRYQLVFAVKIDAIACQCVRRADFRRARADAQRQRRAEEGEQGRP